MHACECLPMTQRPWVTQRRVPLLQLLCLHRNSLLLVAFSKPGHAAWCQNLAADLVQVTHCCCVHTQLHLRLTRALLHALPDAGETRSLQFQQPVQALSASLSHSNASPAASVVFSCMQLLYCMTSTQRGGAPPLLLPHGVKQRQVERSVYLLLVPTAVPAPSSSPPPPAAAAPKACRSRYCASAPVTVITLQTP